MEETAAGSKRICVKEVEDSKAVVLLFGWMGSPLKHVDKYAELYNDRGCSTVSAIADPTAIMTRWKSKIRTDMLRVLPHVAKLIRHAEMEKASRNSDGDGDGGSDDAKVPLIIHAFSNGGVFNLEMLDLELLLREEEYGESESEDKQNKEATDDLYLIGERMKLGWQVFDSAPAYLYLANSMQAIREATGSNYFLQFGIFSLLFTAVGFYNFRMLFGYPSSAEEYWDNMSNSTSGRKQAYIYSLGDEITDVAKLEELIETRRAKGVDLIVMKCEDSAHVQHMRSYKEEYCALIDDVIERSVASCNDGDS
mmetsp:Transcript_7796/g.21051  ORF Transcript_7796/g.21051 Transcript_7796/m.21051 type:complete len:309 (-) Transcript_7796:169-1095(-)|eukprot:CAMPEP_0198127566 /NCGR_PEP_ID=MMETSP1442-20131203/47511_1 /TAXON_ID= /ORGANISM="Craspedostauros australis, Strain CCMP3328" /LENGTH=308 /DNA_ID=CAMNT_0043787557 /DNA_START=34 /DNA_END=960 /DNA_ORIENTATION=-